MRSKAEIEAQIAALQAELAQIEADGFKPLGELAHELEPGDLIELKIEQVVDEDNIFALRSNDHLGHKIPSVLSARKSRPAPALKWITAAEAAVMPDIVGRRVAVEMIVTGAGNGNIGITDGDFARVYTSLSNLKLAVLDDE